jgi:hypothetical protein
VRFMLHNEVTHAVGVPLLAWVLKNVAPLTYDDTRNTSALAATPITTLIVLMKE